MPLLMNKRILAAKIETTVGTAISLSGSDGAFNVFDPTLEEDAAFYRRRGQGSFGDLKGVRGPRGGTCKFKMQLVGGSSVPPWASTFLPACGFVFSSLVAGPVSAPPGVSSVKSLTIGLYENGRYKQLRGAMGNAKFMFKSGQPVEIEFEFKGIFDAPTDVALVAPDYPQTETPLRFVSAGLTIGGASTYKVSDLELDLGNEIVLREDANDASGLISAIITGRQCKGKLDPEAALVATLDTYGILSGLTEGALVISLGTAGNGVAFAAPKLQFTKVTSGSRNGIIVDQTEFQLNRSADLDDDELTITFQ